MKLYVCTIADKDLPGPIKVHSCTKAITALDKAGHTYERVVVTGGRLTFNLTGNRDEVERLSGQQLVPILVLDDSEVITGSGNVVNWARENAPTPA